MCTIRLSQDHGRCTRAEEEEMEAIKQALTVGFQLQVAELSGSEWYYGSMAKIPELFSRWWFQLPRPGVDVSQQWVVDSSLYAVPIWAVHPHQIPAAPHRPTVLASSSRRASVVR